MKNFIPNLKISLLLYFILFALQLVFYFTSPSFYISAPGELDIPGFIKLSFVKYFSLIFFCYALWAGLMAAWNTIFCPQHVTVKTRISLNLAQIFAGILFLSLAYPSILHSYPGFRSLPLFASYLLLAGFLSLASLYFLKQSKPSLNKRNLPAVKEYFPSLGLPDRLTRLGGALVLPLALWLVLVQPNVLNLPPAQLSQDSSLKDILLLGFDALDGDTGNAYLKDKLKDSGAAIFTNAFTPLPLTHPAWNSILSGLYPKNHGVRYFFGSPLKPKHPELYLPKILKKQKGYVSLFAADQPETSYFTQEQNFDDSVLHTIGWESHMVAMLLNHFVFPSVWLNNGYFESLTGLSFNHAALFNYNPNRFLNRTFTKLQNLGEAPKLLTLHSCFLHTPVHLTRQELRSIPNYLKLAPKDFSFEKWPKPGETQITTPSGWINPYFTRRQTLLRHMGNLLNELESKGYQKQSTIVLLSDHGERFVKNKEIYGGVHGVDLKTREQTNVVFSLLDPRMTELKVIKKPVSLIDVTPTLLSTLGFELKNLPYDGRALLTADAKLKAVPHRPLWVESMGYLDDVDAGVEFPQIAVKTLEQSLIYGESGTVTIGEDYYQKIMKKKEIADFSKRKVWKLD